MADGLDGNVVGPDAFDTFIEVLRERVRHERSGADIMLESVCGAQGAPENHTSFCKFPCAPGGGRVSDERTIPMGNL
ncbi:hypothetical protein CYMTET_14171 [Cymbomonas tetramitiformis]|uniref:Uncharacterized protein n=1 Tax=Cymbomonas tetramitiformis TaxID=36881 RepID=A0AAE0LAA3_9CHLO|nr:hypothetical protein CYMTET_14171 [Cymbomonas tetramitiformis]